MVSSALSLVGRVLAGLALFLTVEALLFRSDLYPSILQPKSYAGETQHLIVDGHFFLPQKDRCGVLVLGHSSVFFAFSTASANQMAGGEGFEFFNAAKPVSSLRSWYYHLRELDPESRRYAAIVLPMTSYDDWHIQWKWREIDEIRGLVPMLRYADLPDLAASYDRSLWSRVGGAVLLKGHAYRQDIQDFLKDPPRRLAAVARLHERVQEAQRAPEKVGKMMDEEAARREDGSLAGVTYDPDTNQFSFPRGFPLGEEERKGIAHTIDRSREDATDSSSFVQTWLGRIVDRYDGTGTRVIVFRLPSPFPAARPQIPTKEYSVVRGLAAGNLITLLPEDLFSHLERPEYFSDTRHMNEQGRSRFSPILAREVARQLECPETD